VQHSVTMRGIIPALVTPFDVDEEIDVAALERVIERVLAAGVHGVFVVGSQGEFYALESAEQRALIAAAVRAVDGRVPVYAGVTAVTTREAVARARAAEAAGADAITALPPFFVEPSPEELTQHFLALADATDLPLVLYNQPARTGVALTTDLVVRLAEHPRIVAIKDSSASLNQTAAYVDAVPEDFAVLSGNDAQIAWALLAGADGAIASTANVAPELAVGIYDAVTAGDVVRARGLQRRLARLRATFDLGTFPVVVKEAMALVGEPVGGCRAPVGPLAEDARERLRAVLADVLPQPAARTSST
jgi:4-hydroxy-tetrahydrodipicolinate synthase